MKQNQLKNNNKYLKEIEKMIKQKTFEFLIIQKVKFTKEILKKIMEMGFIIMNVVINKKEIVLW